MKKHFYLALAALALLACNSNPKGNNQDTNDTNVKVETPAENAATNVVDPTETAAPAEEPAEEMKEVEKEDTPNLAEQMEKAEVITVKVPDNFDGITKPQSSDAPIKLKTLSFTENGITDDEVWKEQYQDNMPYQEMWMGNLGETSKDNPFRKFLALPFTYQDLCHSTMEMHGNYNTLSYGEDKFDRQVGYDGSVIVEVDPEFKQVHRILDFRKIQEAFVEKCATNRWSSPEFYGYTLEGDTLFIAMSHNTYANSSKKKNAFILAVDVKNGDIIWMTKPLTCNSQFIIIGNSIVCGYGFSGEPHYVCVIDKKSGVRTQKLTVLKSPEHFSLDGNKLYMRTYSYDYVLSIKK